MPSSGSRGRRGDIPTPKQAPDRQPTVRHTVAASELAHKLLQQAQIDNRDTPAGVNIYIEIDGYNLDNLHYAELLFGILERLEDFGFEYQVAMRDAFVVTKP